MRILVAMPVEKEHMELLESIHPDGEFTYLMGEKPTEDQLCDAEVIIGNVSPKMLQYCKSLRLLQLNMAGSDAFAKKMPAGALLANASGAYGLAISEHMIGMLLMLMKKLYLYRDNQNKCLWRDEGGVTSIEGSVALTVGLGDIGGEFAKRCKALGAYCIGIRRNAANAPAYMDEMYTLEALDSLLPKADIVALALPNSSESRGLMDENRLRKMKKGAILLNVGRGSAIDTDALVRMLNDGHIRAGLDVTDPEPLPANHPLWQCPGVLITPHISGYYHLRQTHDRIVGIAAHNLENLINGKPIKNLVDDETGYRRSENRY